MRAYLQCAGCGRQVHGTGGSPFVCPEASLGNDIDHVLRRHLDETRVRWASGGGWHPYVRYREHFFAYHAARAWGLTDTAFVERVWRLDERIAHVDGGGFVPTPLSEQPALARALGLPPGCRLWVKDETRNVAGSHKARHLMAVALYLAVRHACEIAGQTGSATLPRLAIASCGNAALAAAVLARALDWPLEVFVPADAASGIVSRLQALGASLTACPRLPGVAGDPCYHRFRQALGDGRIPFSCQGNLNALAVEGGQTLGYELLDQLAARGVRLDRLLVQVGGGALASACVHAIGEAQRLGQIEQAPRLHAVQTAGAAPLARAYERVRQRPGLDLADPPSIRAALRYAASHRSHFMWPWESRPTSMASGILDDETYDWLAVLEGLFSSGGGPIVLDEETVLKANALARTHTGIAVCHTGTAGLGGLLHLAQEGRLAACENIAVIFTGALRA